MNRRQLSGGELVFKKLRVFDREMEIATVKRMLRSENVSALTRELG